jgi:hypothetical protein
VFETVTEEQAAAKWREMAPLLDRLMVRTDSQGEFEVAPGSSLAGDDRASDPYQVSHAVRLCLSAGIDHLHAAKVLVVDQAVLHTAAPSSLARGALENFAAAYWILRPDNRNERFERTLRWHAKDARDGAVARSVAGIEDPKASKLDRLKRAATRRGISAKALGNPYRSSEAVRYVDSMAEDLPMSVEFAWRLCSGFAHGRPWAYLGALELEKRPTDSPDVLDVRMSSRIDLALYPNLAAMHLLESLLRLYVTRSTNHVRFW